MADNFLAQVAQIFSDVALHPEFLHLPRMVLTGMGPGPSGAVKHLSMMEHLAAAGYVNVQEVS